MKLIVVMLGLALAVGPLDATLAQSRGSGSGSGSGAGNATSVAPPSPQAYMNQTPMSPMPAAEAAGMMIAWPIASLAPDDVAALKAGRYRAFGKPAEANGYPDPNRVLDHAAELALTTEQTAKVQVILDWTTAQAQELGARYVAAEAAIDAAFRAQSLDATMLATKIAAAEHIRAELRAVHMTAHLETAPVLSPQQRIQYMVLLAASTASTAAASSTAMANCCGGMRGGASMCGGSNAAAGGGTTGGGDMCRPGNR